MDTNCGVSDKLHKHFKRSLSAEVETQNGFENNNIVLTIDNMLQKNADEFGSSPQQREGERVCLTEKLKLLEEENQSLKEKLDAKHTSAEELVLKLNKVEKELSEFKRINTIQENCIENSESEILRLSECLRVTERRFQESVEISEEIISDLNSKLKSTKTKSESGDHSKAEHKHKANLEVKGHQKAHSTNKPSFYVKLNDNNNQGKSFFIIKVLENEMRSDSKHFTISAIKKLSQNGEGLDVLTEVLARKLDDRYGKHWICLLTNTMFDKSFINCLNDSYLRCELNKSVHLVVYKTSSDSTGDNADQNQGESQISKAMASIQKDQTIRVLKKSTNIEANIEKFMINITMDAIHRNFKDYHNLSSFIRDSVCGKYSTQWFVTVGDTQHYYTSWAKAKSRKFMLIEVGDIKITIIEVGGWLW